MEELPPGYRFYPTEEELVSFYLHNKLEGRREDLNRLIDRVIPVVDIYDFNPWDLPQISGAMCHGDPEQWFFFIPRQEREARGGRPNRLTTSGYWKATGSPGYVYSSDNRYIGVKRTMVFYQGRASTGRKSQWKMNEYRAIEGDAVAAPSIAAAPPVLRHEFSLCRVYIKSKSFRAFDRRPSRVVISEQTGGAQQAHGARSDEVATRAISPQNPRAVDKMTSSPESSSSGDHGDQDQHRPPQTGESSSNWDMAVDNEPWWDWEHMNMF